MQYFGESSGKTNVARIHQIEKKFHKKLLSGRVFCKSTVILIRGKRIMNIKDYNELCIKAVTQNIDKNEEYILQRWLAESEHNKNEFERIKKIWASSAPNTVAQIPDIDYEWNALQRRIENHRTEMTEKDSILSKFFSKVQILLLKRWKPAVGFAFVLVLLATGVFLLKNQQAPPQVKTVITQNKEHKLIQLPDGSTVTLNNNSSLSYNESFDDDVREVNLSGEAFFAVTKNTRPFVIMTSNAKTTVLGTKFDVWARDEKTRVFVKEGRVNLAVKQANNSGVILIKNQLSVVKNNLIPSAPKQVESAYLLGWMENKLVFDKTPLNEICDELKRFYNVNLSLENESFKTYTLTGSFKSKDVDSALTIICLALDLKYEKRNDSYVIKAGQMNR
jgi:transmembrane sensor